MAAQFIRAYRGEQISLRLPVFFEYKLLPLLVGRGGMTIQDNDIQAELSYAYFHAVVSRAGFVCEHTSRLADGLGIDAMVHVCEQLAPNSKRTDFSVKVQLKSCSQPPALLRNGKFSYQIEAGLYRKMSNPLCDSVRLLVLMYLPQDMSEWLATSEDSLVCRKCCYWTSLLGAPDIGDQTTKQVHIPKSNLVSVDSFRALMTRISLPEEIRYDG